ncbi:potassium channel family protein [Streptomyces sp. NPDC006208]|uniref:potassium channel family protein n=1 Tax=Streptomyces sp. NPDC006208 TaxID=3156734 RepID=UPI0033A09150
MGTVGRWILGLGLLAAMTTAFYLLPINKLGPDRPAASWTIFVLALVSIAALLLKEIRDVLLERPDTRPGLVIPLLMGLTVMVFASTYYALATHPGQFDGLYTRTDALYFTIVTLATVGYGDITPSGQVSRVVTMMQILYSFVFLTAAGTALAQQMRTRLGERAGRNGRS